MKHRPVNFASGSVDRFAGKPGGQAPYAPVGGVSYTAARKKGGNTRVCVCVHVCVTSEEHICSLVVVEYDDDDEVYTKDRFIAV